MSKNKILLATIISIIFCLNFTEKIDAHQDNYEDYILYISSYNPNFITFNDQISGIKEGLKDKYYLQVEYMDFKSAWDEDIIEFYKIIEYYLTNNEHIKAIILADDAALEFGLRYRDNLFGGLPIVYLGAQNSDNINAASALDDVYGVVEKPSIEKNLDLISQLHSGKTVMAITDDLPTESRELEEFYSLSSKYDNLKFEHISSEEISFYDFKKELNKLDDNYVVLLLDQYRQKTEHYLGIKESSEFIIENTNVPAYCIYDYSVECGFVGGRVISHYEQGKIAGQMMYDILNNKDLKSKIVDSEEVNKYVFNYRQLKKVGISKSELPSNSIIINSFMATLMKYKNFIFPIIILSISLVLIIIAFILYSLKKVHYEKALIEAKEIAERSNRAKNHLIANISHELRTPVAVIMSSNQLLEINMNKSENEKSYSNNMNLNIIKQNCYRLLKLTNNIIDIAKMDTGSMELKPATVNIVSLLEGIVESVIPYAQSKNMDIIFDTTDEDIRMSVDIDKIERILLNLLSNAIKFSYKNSSIYVNITKIKDTFILSVKDEGIGIDKKYFDKIFDKFIQIDDTMMRKNEGSGIGLSIVKSFVQLHEGKIKVISNINKGSEFVVELPIKFDDEDHEILSEYPNSTLVSTNVELSDIYF